MMLFDQSHFLSLVKPFVEHKKDFFKHGQYLFFADEESIMVFTLRRLLMFRGTGAILACKVNSITRVEYHTILFDITVKNLNLHTIMWAVISALDR